MEKQNKKFMSRKENEPRISVRPGNFIVPGEKPQEPRRENGAERAPQKNAPRDDHRAPGGNRQGRHKNNRRGHGHGNGAPAPAAEQRSNTPKAAPAPAAEQKSNAQKAAPVPAQQGGNAPKKQNDRRSRRGRGDRHRRQNDRAAAPLQQTPVTEAPKAAPISESLQRELDAQFSVPTVTPFLSPVAQAERRMSEEESAALEKEFEVDIATAAYLIEDVPCGFPVSDGKAVEVIGVRFRQAGKIYFFAPGSERFKIGEAAIVDTARGPEFGEVVLLNRKMAEKDIIQPLRSVLRRATKEDIAHEAENRKKETEALKICAEKIAAHKLEMHLVDAQYAFDNSKLLFYFTSEGRVDFRELVRDLAGVFRTRIELRQIGIRDESRLIGGLGMCGRPFCCTTFLSDFGQVSVKMAKEQGLSINTSKISGCCGRLMCCLRYEHESYAAEAALTPKKDTRVITPDGPGTVTDATPLTGMVKVLLDNADNTAPAVYHRDKLTVQEPQTPEQPDSPAEEKVE